MRLRREILRNYLLNGNVQLFRNRISSLRLRKPLKLHSAAIFFSTLQISLRRVRYGRCCFIFLVLMRKNYLKLNFASLSSLLRLLFYIFVPRAAWEFLPFVRVRAHRTTKRAARSKCATVNETACLRSKVYAFERKNKSRRENVILYLSKNRVPVRALRTTSERVNIAWHEATYCL